MNNIIEVKNLVKQYGKFTAVNGISFEVKKGEVFGLLGENGAGKTTTLEMIEGLRKPTEGEISISGHSVKTELNQIKEKIGVQLQSSAYFNYLTLKEILELFCSFYKKNANVKTLLKTVDLEDKADSFVGNLSGGQKQRFSIVASLVNNPEIVFLDEPTTGLDPIARRNLWEVITKIKEQGKTIVITTHYMEEAERLCDRIGIMEKGKILAIGPTYELIKKVHFPYNVELVLLKNQSNDLKKFAKFGKVNKDHIKENFFEIHVQNQENLDKILDLIKEVKPEDFQIRKASLEDLFIELTGKKIEE
jgi:ABC-2 type transport system ATP-binding protein